MKKTAITNGLKARLDTLGKSVAWPNVDHDGVTPYLEFTFAAVRREDDSLKGGTLLREVGTFQVAVVVDTHTATQAAEDTADEIAALFPKGTQIPITDGHITMTSAPNIPNGYKAGVEWRIPVLCSYVAVRN